MNDATDGAAGEQDSHGSTQRLVKPTLHDFGKSQDGRPGRREHQSENQSVIDPNISTHQAERRQIG